MNTSSLTAIPRAGDAVILQASGDHLSQQHQRIAEIINDFDPQLELAWIPPSDRNAFDREPFAIFHNSPKYGRYLVGTFREDQMNHQIIAHLFKINNGVNDVLGELEANEAAMRLLNLKKEMDEREELAEFAKAVIKTKKHRYKHNGVVYE